MYCHKIVHPNIRASISFNVSCELFVGVDFLDTESNPPEPNAFEKCAGAKAPIGPVDSISFQKKYGFNTELSIHWY